VLAAGAIVYRLDRSRSPRFHAGATAHGPIGRSRAGIGVIASSDAQTAPPAPPADHSRERPPEHTVRRFVVVALVFGTVFVFVTPAFTGYDEPYHFVRAWELSDGHVHSAKYVHAEDGRHDLGGVPPGHDVELDS